MRRRDFMKTVGFGAAVALYALFFVMFVSMAEANAESERAPYPNEVLKAWERQYQELAKEIKEGQKAGGSFPAKTRVLPSRIFDRHALILPADG